MCISYYHLLTLNYLFPLFVSLEWYVNNIF